MTTNYAFHDHTDHDAARVTHDLQAATTHDGRLTSSRAGHIRFTRMWSAVRDLFAGVAEANRRFDELNRPWIYAEPVYTVGSNGATRLGAPDDGASRPFTPDEVRRAA